MRVTQHQPDQKMPTGSWPPVIPFAVEAMTGRHASTVRVSGEIDAARASEFGDALLSAGRDGREVLVDLDETSFIDSAGIRVLVRSMWTLRGSGSSLRLVAASPMAENILRITGILDVLKEPTP